MTSEEKELYDEAYSQGKSNGYREGYDDGHNDGYKEGYAAKFRPCRPWQKAIMKDSINIKFVPKSRDLDLINKKEAGFSKLN